jgi:Tfp pilus assembly protein PilX
MKRAPTQRGSMLIYAMLTMSVMLAVGITLNALFVSKLRLANAERNTIVALYAADSGAEECIYEYRTGTDEPALTMDNGATVTITDIASGTTVTDCSTQLTPPEQFRSTGAFRGATRALEISF